MRLIDADKSIESIANLLSNGATITQAIGAQPTAYDVDKVIEELTDELIKSTSSEFDYGMARAYEIVKGGGVNE